MISDKLQSLGINHSLFFQYAAAQKKEGENLNFTAYNIRFQLRELARFGFSEQQITAFLGTSTQSKSGLGYLDKMREITDSAREFNKNSMVISGVIIDSPFHIEMSSKKKVLLVVPTSDMRTTINLHYFKHQKRRVELTVSPHELGYFVHDFKEIENENAK